MVIHVLDQSTINKIAAGEVIDRPASIVKELIENSFDANSDYIKIDIENGGIDKIKISDNGSGMDREDCILSIKRHTTSKISSEFDLYNINSFGFRGEALGSISEISDLKIITKREDDEIGTLMESQGGKIKNIEPIICKTGTTIEVTNLFFNMPVKKDYLKSSEIEFSQILKIISKYALIKKEVAIILTHNGKEIINSQKTDNFLNKVIFLLGVDVGRNLIEINYKEEGLIITGFISKPSLTRADKTEQSVYVNQRYVKDRIISQAVYDAYDTLLFINRHPIFILNIQINSSLIDVNVHPNKEFIKFKNEKEVYEIVYNAIKSTLFKTNLIVDANLNRIENSKINKHYDFSIDKQTNLFKTNDYKIKEDVNLYLREAESQELNKEVFGKLNILGQINKTFIICEAEDGLILFDQHAAEERVNYEKFLNDLKINAIKKQSLIEQKILDLNPEQKNIALYYKQFLSKIGFEFEDFDGNILKLSTIPEIFGRLKSILFVDILNELIKEKKNIINNEIESRIIKFACKASVKAGDELTKEELKKLIKDLEKCENPFSCPHGRPTTIKLSISELEKKFKRTGW